MSNTKERFKKLIILEVEKFYNVSLSSMQTKSKEEMFVWPRQTLEYCLYDLIQLSPREISMVSTRTRSNLYHSIETVLNEIETKSDRGKQFELFHNSLIERIELLKKSISESKIIEKKCLSITQLISILDREIKTYNNLVSEFNQRKIFEY